MFYDNLKTACSRNGVKVTQVLKECGISTSATGAWKSGAAPRSDIVKTLSTRLNISTDYLLFGKEAQNDIDAKTTELLNIFSTLDDEGQSMVIAAAYHEARRMAAEAEAKRKLSWKSDMISNKKDKRPSVDKKAQ